jgi:chaperonin GroES
MAQATLEPIEDRIIVKRIGQQTDTYKGLIIIPDTAKEIPQEGIIIAVGPGLIKEDGSRAPMDVAVGDRILFGKFSGSEVTIAEETLLIMRAGEIFCKVVIKEAPPPPPRRVQSPRRGEKSRTPGKQ